MSLEQLILVPGALFPAWISVLFPVSCEASCEGRARRGGGDEDPSQPPCLLPLDPQGTTFASPWRAACVYFSWAEVVIFIIADTSPVDLE